MLAHQKRGYPISASRRGKVESRIERLAAVGALAEVPVVDGRIHDVGVVVGNPAVHAVAAPNAVKPVVVQVGSVVLGSGQGHCRNGIRDGNFVVLGNRKAQVLGRPGSGAAVGGYVHAAVCSGPYLGRIRLERQGMDIGVHKGLASAARPVGAQGPVGSSVGRAPNVDATHQDDIFVHGRGRNGQVVPALAACSRAVHAPVQQIGVGRALYLGPRHPAVGRPVYAQQAVVVGAVHGVYVVGVCHRRRDFGPDAIGCGQTCGHHRPGSPKICGSVNAGVVVGAGVQKTAVPGNALDRLEGSALYR